MRVLFVSRGFPPHGRWGTESYTLQLARGLARLGHEVSVFHPDVRDDLEPYRTYVVENGPFRVTRMALPRRRGKRLEHSYEDAALERVFERVLRDERPDVVHFTYLLWTLSVRLPERAKAFGAATVLTATDYGLVCHRGQCFDWRLEDCGGPRPAADCARCIREPSRDDGPALEVAGKRWLARALALGGGFGRVVVRRDLERREAVVRGALAAVDQAIAPTAPIESLLVHAGLPRERVARLVYAVDDALLVGARARPDGASPLPGLAPGPAPGGEPVAREVRLAFLGQFAPHKGAHVFVDAVERMAHRLPESVESWSAWIYGEGVEGRHRRYPALLRARAKSPRIVFAPPFEATDAAAVLARISCVVVPSLWRENAPLSALEARAAGIPVIASDVPGLAEILEPGVHGALFPPGDSAALADLLRAVVLGRIAPRHAPTQPISYTEHVARVVQLYQRARERAGLARGRGPTEEPPR